MVAGCGGAGSLHRGNPPHRTTPVPTTAASPTPSPSSTITASWPVYHQNPLRTGQSSDTPAPISLALAWRSALDGAVYGEPIVVGGEIVVATENDSVYGLEPGTGAVIWRTHLGTPVPRADLPCGDIFPLGITGTPAYDPATDSIFVVAEELIPSVEHVLYALNPVTGAVRWSRRVDILIPSEYANAVQQRPALAVANGYVYIGFGGLDGDCSQYRGAVVAAPTSNQGSTLDYVVPTTREGAVWATGGPVVDASGNLYVSTGNGAASGGAWDHSDSVLEFSPPLTLVSAFAPTSWASDNLHDLDLGSVAPTLLPNGLLFMAGKGGVGYVLRQSNLGGVGGQIFRARTCGGGMAFGGTAVAGGTLYLPCASGLEAIGVAANGHFTVRWQTHSGANGPPVLGGGCAFSVDTNNGTLVAISLSSGATVATARVGAVPHFVSPTLLGSLALVGTDSGLVAITGA